MRGAPGGGDVGRAGDDVVDALAAGAVGDERLAPAVEVVAPGVARSRGTKTSSSHRLGPEPPDAAARSSRRDAVRRLDVAVDVDRLVEVEPAVRPPAERVDDVVRVLGAEAGEHDAAAGRPCRRRRCRSRWTSSVLLATYAPPSPGSTPVGMSRPSAKTVVLSALPSPSVSSRTMILSFAFCARLDLRVDLAATRPRAGPAGRSSSGSAWPAAGRRRRG